ncbi:hypothetical protein Ddye_014606 [Dipteronia dyeriana]|uniref:K Homology domain-containing protein n=1 Tax=Dipteronia dyeriana TaxID=168575 RepID=A0AAD9X8A9_9ROSI|nr:hypothetical protein Ddye_014606 [Dipteronia dyeriana]
MLSCSRSLFGVKRVLKFSTTYVNSRPIHYFQEKCSYYSLICSWKMSWAKHKPSAFDGNKKPKTKNLVWRPSSTQAAFSEESSVKDVIIESENGNQIQEVHCSISSNVSDTPHAREIADAMDEATISTLNSSTLQDNVEDKVLEGDSVPSADKHSLSIEIGTSVIRFVRGKEGTTQKKIEEEMGVKLIFPLSRKEDSIIIEGISLENVTRASERIQTIIDEAVKSPALDYSHFVSLPLAIHPELVDKLVKFQNSILGVSDTRLDEDVSGDSNEGTSDNKDKDQKSEKVADVAVKLKVGDNSERVKVNRANIPLVSYAPKASNSSNLSVGAAELGIDKSIFNKPKTFHLTVLMLKLWNKDRVNAATEVLKSISSKVMDALDNRPVFVRLKGLDCMKGPLAKARVLYIPVEEIGDGDRLRHSCQVITDAFAEAGLVLEKDVNKKLKLHATVMNVSHRKRMYKTRKFDCFDAQGIFKQFGSEVWGEYLIREAHLSQRFVYDDESGYYHCCASIPFPENMQVD